MKKAYLLITAAVLAIAGCSKVGPDHSGDPNAWMYDESLPVPIMLGTPGAETMTKVGIGNDDLPTEDVGVFALDTRANSEAWGQSSLSELLINESATITDGNVTFAKTKYYPLDNSHYYTFYSYYPHVSSAYAKLVGSQYRLTYTLTGTADRDILWAKSIAEPVSYQKEDGSTVTLNGYNAAYIRKGGAHPALTYHHMLTALTFKLKATAEDYEKLVACNAKVTKLTITNTYNKVDLIIADKDDDSNSGTLDISQHASDRKDIALKLAWKGSTASSTLSIPMTDWKQNGEDKVLDFGEGNGLLLVPKTVTSEDFTGVLEIRTYDNVEGSLVNETVHKLSLTFKADFEAGKIYNFTILVRAPEQILATASMESWGDANEGEVDYGDDSYLD